MRCLICFFLLAAAATAQMAQVNPARGYRIGGIVVNAATGQVLSNIGVSIGPAEGGPVATCVSASDGRFGFEKLKPGKYWLQAEGRGFAAQRFDQHEDFSTAIAVGQDIDSEHLIFRLRPEGEISGIVTDVQNEPVDQASVMLFRTGVQNGVDSTEMRAQIMTDDRGVYRFGHVAQGAYYIVVSARPWYAENSARLHSIGGSGGDPVNTGSGILDQMNREFDVVYPITYYPGVTDAALATPVTVRSGDKLAADIALTAVPSLHMRVRDSDIKGREGVGMSANERVFGSATVPVALNYNAIAPGEFEISGIAPGEYDLRLQIWGKNPSSREEEIAASDDSEVDASGVPAALSLSGTVQMDSGQALPKQMFVGLLTRHSKGAYSAQVSPKGDFVFDARNMRPATYDVFAGGVQQLYVRTIEAEGATAHGHQIEIPAGGSVQLKIILSQGVGRIDGTALLGGKPFAGAMIALIPEDIEYDSSLVRRDQSDSDGTFTLYNVLPGKYSVVAIQNGWDLPWMSSGVLEPYLKSGEVVSVASRAKYEIKVNVQ